MAEMTLEQRKALALAAARIRLQEASPVSGMSRTDILLSGMGKAVSDTNLGLRQIAPGAPTTPAAFARFNPHQEAAAISARQQSANAEIAASRARDVPLMASGYGIGGNILGNVLLALPTTALVPGMNTISGGASVGAIQGIIQPALSSAERAKNAAIGAVAGAVVPAAMRAYKFGKSLFEPLYESGREQIVGRALNRAAGANAPQVQANLQNAKTLVPGSEPTVAEVANDANLAALQRTASALRPQDYVARGLAQNEARVNALLDMAGTSGQREFFDAARKQAANELYQRAYATGIDQGAVTSGVKGEITKLLQRPAIQAAIKDAKTLAANEGVSLKNPAGSVKGLDYVKRALDDQISSAVPGSNQARVLTDLKNRLLTTIDRLSPSYAEARTTFSEMSKPIAQMDVAQEIADRSINKLTGALQPSAFARALQDKTAQSATGFNRATLSNVLSPEQNALLGNLKADLARSAAAQNMGRGAGSDTVQKLAQANILEQAGVPTFLRNLSLLQIPGNIASRGASVLYGDANQRIADRLAMSLLTPNDAARLMAGAQLTPMGTLIAEAARVPLQGGLLALPAIMNAQQ